MPLVEFEPTISAGERSQTYALDRAAARTGYKNVWKIKNYIVLYTTKYKIRRMRDVYRVDRSTHSPAGKITQDAHERHL
jgi:hypothetical protein